MHVKTAAFLGSILPLALSLMGCYDIKDALSGAVEPVPNDTIDVLMVVTPEAEAEISAAYPASGSVDTYLEYVLEYTNSAALSSGANVNFHLAASYESTVSESVSLLPNDKIKDGFNWLRGEMLDSSSAIYSERDTSSADIVVMLTETDKVGKVIGMARLSTGTDDYDYKRARAVVEWNQINGIAHEIGHILGMKHDIARLDSKGHSLKGYEHGLALPDKLARSIMAYNTACDDATPPVTCRRVPLFTNPDVAFSGQILGSSDEFNACVIEERKSYLASFDEYMDGTARPTEKLSKTCPWTLGVGETYCSGGSFTTDSELSDFSACTVIIDDLTLSGTGVTTTSNFASVHTIKGDLTIEDTDISNLAGFSNLSTLRGELTLIGDSLSDISDLSALTSVEGDISIVSTSLTRLIGLDGLTEIQSLDLETNASLLSLEGLDSLTTIHGSMEIQGNDSLESCDGVESLGKISDSLLIVANDELSSVGAFDTLVEVGTLLNVTFNPELDDCVFAGLDLSTIPTVTISLNGTSCSY